MTSPDNKDLSAYQKSMGQRVGDWEMDVDLEGIADNLLAKPAAWLMHVIHGTPIEDYDTIDEIKAAVLSWASKYPILGDLAEALSGVEDGDLNDIGSFVNKVKTDILSAFGLAKKADQTATNVAAQAYFLGENQAANAGKGFWQGIDSSAEVSVPVAILDKVISITAATSRGAVVIMDSTIPKQSVVFMAYKSGSVTGFFLDVYRMSLDDGSVTLQLSSNDLSGNLATAQAWQEAAIAAVPVDVGTCLVVMFRMVGSGTVYFPAKMLSVPIMLPGRYPRAHGLARNGSGAPNSFTDAQLMPLYTGDTPHLGMGIEGRSNDRPRYFFDDFNRQSFGPLWAVTDTSGGYGPALLNNRVAYGFTNADGTEGITYVQPMLTDAIRVGWDITNSNSYTASGVTMHATSDQTGNALIIGNFSGSVRMGVGKKASDANAVTVKEVLYDGNGHFECEYTPADNTYRVYKDGSDVAFMEWTDTTNRITHGSGHRFCGVWVSRAFFFNSGYVDNWSAADVDN